MSKVKCQTYLIMHPSAHFLSIPRFISKKKSRPIKFYFKLNQRAYVMQETN